ncbi:CHC2 zinc finger domain-containing protein [Olivibacter jilunii]|uniref:CHC2 zinc finger domain-containing protein n=1 Tax=Olivibacter jilunii TaxID=985016 RepID=UPI0010301781|nr:CHC2 zinc finger domain-containing protein [Olivibacter jilunii]
MDYEFKEKIRKLKERDLVDYLESIGYKPTRIRGNDYWYLSPLRDENSASFKVDRKNNCWFDHGMHIGGNLIDFAIRFHKCTVGEFMKMANENYFLFHQDTAREKKIVETPENKVEIITDRFITRYPLLKYLNERRIDREIASHYCREVTFRIGEKEYYGIGMQNDSGAWEIRNPYMKVASYPKDITTIRNGQDSVNVFEGFFNFLSYETIMKARPELKHDYVILNTLGMFERARPFMESHTHKNLFLDNGKGGDNYTRFALELELGYTDLRALYKNHGDLNDWLQHFGRPPAKSKGLKQ